jgi:hypothetical protein
MRLSTISKDIVAALLPLTTHKRHKTRIAAVEAVRDVMHLVSIAVQVLPLQQLACFLLSMLDYCSPPTSSSARHHAPGEHSRPDASTAAACLLCAVDAWLLQKLKQCWMSCTW